MFLEQLLHAAKEKCQLDPTIPTLVGVSGGADSIALMIGLHNLGYEIIVAHLDHGLRKESSQDAEFVKNAAKKYRLPFFSERIEVGDFARENHMSLEEAARKVRYEFLFELARENDAQAVAVAHQADDQVETVLMHFLRGAALDGLSGMAFHQVIPLWDEAIPLVRPLLDVRREMIDDFLTEIDVTPQVDRSNLDTTYFRNRLRHELIPELVTYNPSIRKTLIRMSKVLREEDQFLKELAEESWKDCFLNKSLSSVELCRPKFIKLNKSSQRRVLRRAISLLRPDLRDVGFDVVDKGLHFAIEQPKYGQIDLVSRLHIAVVEDLLIIKNWDANLPDLDKPLLFASSAIEFLDIDHPVDLKHSWQLVAEIFHPSKDHDICELVKEVAENETWLDWDRIQRPLVVRGRHEGDRFQPLGMSGHSQKLHDFFINEKIPEHIRDVWPLVWSGDDIAWVCGLRPSERYRITENSDKILKVRLIKQDK